MNSSDAVYWEVKDLSQRTSNIPHIISLCNDENLTRAPTYFQDVNRKLCVGKVHLFSTANPARESISISNYGYGYCNSRSGIRR